MTIKEGIQKGVISLKMENIDTPKMKARLIMQFVLQKDRQYIVVHDGEELTQRQEEKYKQAIDQLKQGIPLEHLTHQREFMKLTFFVDENVLIPRQDTEKLVEVVIELAKTKNKVKILDLCTGSGAIGISLAKYLPNSEITASDISHEAIQIAKKNAIHNEVENQITFIESNLWENIPKEKYDIIVSNPPYIKREVIQKLEKQVRKEPIIALDGGWDGLTFYRKIIHEAKEYLKFQGYLCLEIGYDQKEEVTEIFQSQKNYGTPVCYQDYGGNNRVIISQLR